MYFTSYNQSYKRSIWIHTLLYSHNLQCVNTFIANDPSINFCCSNLSWNGKNGKSNSRATLWCRRNKSKTTIPKCNIYANWYHYLIHLLSCWRTLDFHLWACHVDSKRKERIVSNFSEDDYNFQPLFTCLQLIVELRNLL